MPEAPPRPFETNATVSPAGDHAGSKSKAVSSVIGWTPDPSAFMTKSRQPLFVPLVNAILWLVEPRTPAGGGWPERATDAPTTSASRRVAAEIPTALYGIARRMFPRTGTVNGA